MSENKATQTKPSTEKPNPDLKDLERMIGTWEVSGGIQGTQTFEGAEGGFFIIHRFDFQHDGRKIKGIEIIGHEHKLGAEPDAEIKTRLYSFLDGMTLEYVWESDGNGFIYWFGGKGSEGFMKGEFSDDGNKYTAEWTFPGGGYEVVGTKIREN